MPHDTLASYPWFRSVKTGVWLRALGNGDQRRPMGRKAREELYIYVYLRYTSSLQFTFNNHLAKKKKLRL